MTRANRRSTRKPSTAWLTAALLIGAAALLPSVASATTFYGPNPRDVTHTRPSSCPEWRLCVYINDNFTGSKSLRREKWNPNWGTSHFENGQTMGDRASSIFNSSPYRTKRLFEHDTYGGHVLCLAPRTGIRDLYSVEWIDTVHGPNGDIPIWHTLEDRISSHSTHDENINNLRCDWRAK